MCGAGNAGHCCYGRWGCGQRCRWALTGAAAVGGLVGLHENLKLEAARGLGHDARTLRLWGVAGKGQRAGPLAQSLPAARCRSAPKESQVATTGRSACCSLSTSLRAHTQLTTMGRMPFVQFTTVTV